MSGFTGFERGELAREIAIRGLSIEGFARIAKVDPATVARAIKGERSHPGSIGKMIRALGAIPVLEGPIELVKAAS